jgi:D-alanyl-D-alanine carboxypeptidase
MPSANNAASALARSTGLSMDEFAARMNEKAASLGAVNSHFNEPTGMDENNVVTARDYVHIVAAAFSNPYMQKIAGLQQYALKSANNSKYNQTIKNTDKLLADADLQMIGAKTGYLTAYNFAALLTYKGEKLAVVVLGEDHLTTAFAETKILAGLGSETRFLALAGAGPAVLGTSTQVSLLHYPNL